MNHNLILGGIYAFSTLMLLVAIVFNCLARNALGAVLNTLTAILFAVMAGFYIIKALA